MNQIIMNLSSAIIGAVIGSFATYFFEVKKQKASKRLQFIEKQLNEFYSPMLSYRRDIEAKLEIESTMNKLSHEAWEEHCNRTNFDGIDAEHLKKAFEPFDKIIEYNNEQFRNCTLQKYKKMFQLFGEKMGLVREEDRTYYSEFSTFIDVWDRWLSESVPREVLIKFGSNGDEKLQPFFDILENRVNELQNKLLN